MLHLKTFALPYWITLQNEIAVFLKLSPVSHTTWKLICWWLFPLRLSLLNLLLLFLFCFALFFWAFPWFGCVVSRHCFSVTVGQKRHALYSVLLCTGCNFWYKPHHAIWEKWDECSFLDMIIYKRNEYLFDD